MLKRVDIPKVKKTMEFLPGGDIRLKDNLGVRAAFCDSGLSRVPREGQIREVFFKIVKKKKIGSQLSGDQEQWFHLLCVIWSI